MRHRMIYCIELDQVFANASDAKRKTGVDGGNILKVCKGLRASAGKHPKTKEPLHWEYVEDKEEE